jgi:hypothetical protein
MRAAHTTRIFYTIQLIQIDLTSFAKHKTKAHGIFTRSLGTLR